MLSVKGTCEFCGRPRNDILYGPLHKQKDIKCHYYCLLFSHILDQNGSDEEGILGFLLPDIRKALEKGKDMRCSYCRRPGALSKCFNSKCKRIFHLPCGLEKGSLHLYYGDFRSFCSEHRQKQRVPADVLNSRDVLCSVCFDPVEDLTSNDSLWAPCCKKNGWFHRLCIQKFALSAAYFFKCPLCANQKKFRDAMLKNGIYIPDQDASWELEPNAFAELLERHNKCDAAVCKCPKGRDYSAENPRLWTLILCQNCGSKGIHIGCIPGPRSSVQNRSMWDCPECQAVMKNCSLQREEILSMSRQSVSGDESEDDIIVVDADVISACRNDSEVFKSETSAPSQDVKSVLSSAIHLVSSSSAEVVDLVNDEDEDDIMELAIEDEDKTLHDEKLSVLVKQDNVCYPQSSGTTLVYVPKEVNQSPDQLPVFQSSSSWVDRTSWSSLSHEAHQQSHPSNLKVGETFGHHRALQGASPSSDGFKIVNPEEILKSHVVSPLVKITGTSVVPVITLD
ncbi:PHD finger protein 7-like isoform X2 [Ischnura elegans]|uniref:PHD finger protein 7-like isoform X2 n=1 Tax=Ischnura elegans TaxID=197161 RepID=UPI001ED8754A|nr:PHD finger protein 7-like isoform X2 [Ischnura elegans]